jgi:hypothetical protein
VVAVAVNTVIEVIEVVIVVVIAMVITAIIGKDGMDEKTKAANWSPLRVLICRYCNYFLPFAASWTLSPAFSNC